MSLLQLRQLGGLLPLTSKQVLQQLIVSGQARLRRCTTKQFAEESKSSCAHRPMHTHMAVYHAHLTQQLAQSFA